MDRNEPKADLVVAGSRMCAATRLPGQAAHGVAPRKRQLQAAGKRGSSQERELEFVGVRVGIRGPAEHGRAHSIACRCADSGVGSLNIKAGLNKGIIGRPQNPELDEIRFIRDDPIAGARRH